MDKRSVFCSKSKAIFPKLQLGERLKGEFYGNKK
jgi:hypothetical protein